jgi:hypothetical protein
VLEGVIQLTSAQEFQRPFFFVQLLKFLEEEKEVLV